MLLALVAYEHEGSKLYLQRYINQLLALSGKGLQSSLLVEVLVSGSRDACMSVNPKYILAAVKRLSHPKAKSVVCVALLLAVG